MFSFVQFILESIGHDRILKNPSLNAMMATAKVLNKRGENLRYAIDKDGNTVAGRSGKYTHWDLADKGDPSEIHTIEGGVHYDPKTDSHSFSAIDQYNNYRDKENKHPVEHPLIRRMSQKMKLNNDLHEQIQEKKTGNRSIKIPDNEVKHINSLRDQGHSVYAISDIMGYASTVIRRHMKSKEVLKTTLDLKLKQGRDNLSDGHYKRAYDMRREGKTDHHIAGVFGMASNVPGITKRLEMPPNKEKFNYHPSNEPSNTPLKWTDDHYRLIFKERRAGKSDELTAEKLKVAKSTIRRLANKPEIKQRFGDEWHPNPKSVSGWTK